MSYKPKDFEQRFIMPAAKAASEYERPITPTEFDREPLLISSSTSAEERPHLEPRSPTAEPVQVDEEPSHPPSPSVHLQPRPATIEPVDKVSENERASLVTPLTSATVHKKEEKHTSHLHGAGVELPELDLRKPGPTEASLATKTADTTKAKVKKDKKKESATLAATPVKEKAKKSSSDGGLCAACFGSKSKKQKGVEGTKPIEQLPVVLESKKEEQKKDESLPPPPPVVIVSSDVVGLRSPVPPPNDIQDQSLSSSRPPSQYINIDQFRQPRTPNKSTTSSMAEATSVLPLEPPADQLGATIDALASSAVPLLVAPHDEPHYQLPSGEPIQQQQQQQQTAPPPDREENEYALSDRTYDIPRPSEPEVLASSSVELPKFEPGHGPDTGTGLPHVAVEVSPQEEEKKQEQKQHMAASTGASGDFAALTPAEKSNDVPSVPTSVDLNLSGDSTLVRPIINSRSPVAPQIDADMPRVDINETSTKGSYTLPPTQSPTKSVKKEKKSKTPKEKKSGGGLFGKVFGGSQKSSPEKLRAPAVDLPPLDITPSPAADVVSSRRSPSPAKEAWNPRIPYTELPLVQYPVDLSSANVEQQPQKLQPQLQQQQQQHHETAVLETGLALASPLSDLLHIQTQHDQFPLETDYVGPPPESLTPKEVRRQEVEGDVRLPSAEREDDTGFSLPRQQFHPEYACEHHKSSPVDGDDMSLPPIPTSISDVPEVPHLSHGESDLTASSLRDLDTLSTPDNTGATLLSNELQYTITDTRFINPPDLNGPSVDDIVNAKPSDLEPHRSSVSSSSFTSPLPPQQDFSFQLPSTEPVPVPTSPARAATPSPPSFDDHIPSASSHLITSNIGPAVTVVPDSKKQKEKERIHEGTTPTKVKSSTAGKLCSCFGDKSAARADKSMTMAAATTKEKKPPMKESHPSKKLTAPRAELPPVDMPLPSSNVSSLLKTKGPLRAPAMDLPPFDTTVTGAETIRLPALSSGAVGGEKKRQAPKLPSPPEQRVPSPQEATVPSIDLSPLSHGEQTEKPTRSVTPPPTPNDQRHSQVLETKEVHTSFKRVPSLEQLKPIIPDLDLAPLSTSGGDTTQTSFISKQYAPPPPIDFVSTSSRSDSGLEAILFSHMQPSSTLEDIPAQQQQHQPSSVSSGLGSEILESVITKGYTFNDIQQSMREEKEVPPLPQPSGPVHVDSSNEQTEIKRLSPSASPSSTPKRENSLLRHDFSRRITLTSDIHAKLIYCQSDLKRCLETEIPRSMEPDEFDAKKDSKALSKILGHGIDLVKEKRVSTYPELKQKLIVEHKHDAFLVGPVVRALYVAIEKEGLDNLEKPEFALAIRDMVRLPAKQTFETVSHLQMETSPNKQQRQSAVDSSKQETEHVSPAKDVPIPIPDASSQSQLSQATTSAATAATTITATSASSPSKKPASVPLNNNTTTSKSSGRSCLMCGRSSKGGTAHKEQKDALSSPSISQQATGGLLDDRRKTQLNVHKSELANVLRDHILEAHPPIQHFPEHSKEVDKIIRKSLIVVAQPKVNSYEQVRNELKTEFKQNFYLVDPIVDIVRDTVDHCDLTQMSEKVNLNILDSNIEQTAELYNQAYTQSRLLTPDELELQRNKSQSWLRDHLTNKAAKDKKLNKKQTKELAKVLDRALEIVTLQQVQTWDEVAAQLKREHPKSQDLCDRAVDLLKQGQKDGLLSARQAPGTSVAAGVSQDVTQVNVINGVRRPSSLITERARHNLNSNRPKIVAQITRILADYNKPLYQPSQIEQFVQETFTYLERLPPNALRDYQEVKEHLKKDHAGNHEKLIEQTVDVIEQAHATSQLDDLEKQEVQTLMRDRLNGKPLILKEMYVSLPPRVGVTKNIGGLDSTTSPSSSNHPTHLLSASALMNGDQHSSPQSNSAAASNNVSSHRVGRGLSWREANERARILFYRGKHPAIHYNEQESGFDVRMLLETTSGGTQEIPVTDSDVHELLNSCGVQWDGLNLISLVDHSDEVVRAAEQAALKVIREKGVVDLRTIRPETAPDDVPLSSSLSSQDQHTVS